MSADTAGVLTDALDPIASNLRITELRSVYTADFHINGTCGYTFPSSMEIDKATYVVKELILRFPPVDAPNPRGVETEFDLFVADTNAPAGTRSRVCPRRGGQYAPHIILQHVSLDEALRYTRRVTRLYRR